MNEFLVEYVVIAKGVLTVEADNPDQAKEVMKSFKEFELYDDSREAEIKIGRIIKK